MASMVGYVLACTLVICLMLLMFAGTWWLIHWMVG